MVSSCYVYDIVSAYAEPYQIEEHGFSVDIPEKFDVLYRDMDADDPLLAEYGVTSDVMNQYLAIDDIYIEATSKDETYDITVMVSITELSQEIFDLSDYSSSDISSMRADFEAGHGTAFTFWNVETVGPAKFVVYETDIPGETKLFIRHITTYINGKMLSVILYVYDDTPITDEMRMEQNLVVGSIAFDEILENPNKSLYDRITEGYVDFISTTVIGGILFVVLAVLGIYFRIKKN